MLKHLPWHFISTLLEANMQKHNITLSSYFTLLNNHITEVANFNAVTNEFLSSATAADLYFEDVGKRIFIEMLGFNVSFSSSQKILVLIKEIAEQSKSYLDKFISYSKILDELIKFISSVENS
jgi:hypothetical protein